MKRAIVCTTINPPTEALKKFAEIAVQDDWQLIIVGDMKTPDAEYDEFCEQYEGAVTYLDMKTQETMSKELSDLIGPNCIQRRNFGFIHAYGQGAEVIATVDDDNIPYPRWGKNVRVGVEYSLSVFNTKSKLFDPLSPIYPHLWHRGFPLQLLDQRTLSNPKHMKRKILVQADLWDGSPDVDAVCRITLDPQVKANPALIPYTGNVMGPFNSQNTFLHRDCFPTFFLFPHIGRMDDIWASYYLQGKFRDSVAYAKASVIQKRNPHDLVKDLDGELLGYHHSLEFAEWCMDGGDLAKAPAYMPAKSIKAFKVYKDLFKGKA